MLHVIYMTHKGHTSRKDINGFLEYLVLDSDRSILF